MKVAANGQVSIRNARIDNDGRLYELLCELARTYLPYREEFDRNLPLIIYDASTYLRVAEENGFVVGYSLAILQWTLYANGQILVLQELVVDANRQKQGIGAQLIADLLDTAQTASAKEITVATRRAKDYYPRFGFMEVAGNFKLRL